MESGALAKWHVKEGEAFAAGDIIADVETDKATMGWEAQDEGIMGKILVAEGTEGITVGTLVAVTVDDEDEVAGVANYTAAGAGSSTPEPKAAAAAPAEAPAGGGGRAASAFPRHEVWTMPALSPTMDKGNVVKWNKAVGDEVVAGDLLVEIETDKATMDWTSVEDGFVAKILHADGAQDVPVGSPVCVIVEDADLVSQFSGFQASDADGGGGGSGGGGAAPEAQPAAAAAPPAAAPAQPAAPKAAAPASAPGGRVVASPYARKLAAAAGVDLANLSGSGLGGRIVAADVQAAEASGGAAPSPAPAGQPTTPTPAAHGNSFQTVKNSQIKRITARRLLESKTTVPHYYLTVECRIDALSALRAQLNDQLAAAKAPGKLSVNDFVVKASACALRAVPEVNASWTDEAMRVYDNVDISIAVQTEHGLMVPIVMDADYKGLASISTEIKALADKAKNNKLQPHEFTGGTFTISNLGMFGVKSFAAIINPPQAAILAVGGADKKVILGADGQFTQATMMSVTLSCDHRVIDGAMGATWLKHFKGFIEAPSTMML